MGALLQFISSGSTSTTAMRYLLITLALLAVAAVSGKESDFEAVFSQSQEPALPPLMMPPAPTEDRAHKNADASSLVSKGAEHQDAAKFSSKLPEASRVPEPHGDVIEQVAALMGSDMAPHDDMMDADNDTEGDLVQSSSTLAGSNEIRSKKQAYAKKQANEKRSKNMLSSINKNMGIKMPYGSASVIDNPSLKPAFEGRIDDWEDKYYHTHKKNSVGQNRIYGRGANPKLKKNGQVKPPGYTIEDAHFGPAGHYYLGSSRRRIGSGFGRRRRTYKEKEDKVSKINYHKRLLRSIARRKRKSERHNKTCSFKICPKGTPGYKKKCKPDPRDCEKDLWCVKGRCMGYSYSSSYTSSYSSSNSKTTKRFTSVITKTMAKKHKHTSERMVKKALKRTKRVVDGLPKGPAAANEAKAKKQKEKLDKSKKERRKKGLERRDKGIKREKEMRKKHLERRTKRAKKKKTCTPTSVMGKSFYTWSGRYCYHIVGGGVLEQDWAKKKSRCNKTQFRRSVTIGRGKGISTYYPNGDSRGCPRNSKRSASLTIKRDSTAKYATAQVSEPTTCHYNIVVTTAKCSGHS